MKSFRYLVVASSLALGACWLNAADSKAPAPAGTPANCCVKAAKAGKTCEHDCCAAAAKEGKNCEKCGGKNTPPAKS
jgi:hypothetical protein